MQNNEEKHNKLCKIVYLDEGSVTDFVQIAAGGELDKTTELLKSTDASEAQEGKLAAKGGIGGIFKMLFGFEASASAEITGGLEFSTRKIAKNIVKNTILTDFIDILETKAILNNSSRKTGKGAIKKFVKYSITAEKDSLSYMVMVSPYLDMIKTGTSIPAGEFNIAIDKLNQTLRNAKGYYEFVGSKAKSKVIFRFNIDAFKNGYTISDLLKMDLSIYAIKVGQTSLEMLDVSKELDMESSLLPKDNPSYDGDDVDTIDESKLKKLDVFDVMLAGVETDD
jgi:hypothetical protein